MTFIPTRLYANPVEPDDYDKGMVDTFLKSWNSHFHNSPDFPRVGDFIIMPDGSYERAAYVWEDGIQTCISGSFALGNGYATMSGSLNPSIPKDRIVNTGEKKEGTFWTFHRDMWHADNGIGIKCACRVFRVI